MGRPCVRESRLEEQEDAEGFSEVAKLMYRGVHANIDFQCQKVRLA